MANPNPPNNLKGPGPGRPLDEQLLPEDEQGWENFDKLLALQCTGREIAAFYNRSETWVHERVQLVKGMKFAEYAAMTKPKGLVSLRRKQMEMALAGDRTMLVWLGKQYLGQSDKSETRVSGPDGKPIEVRDVTDPSRIVLEGIAQIAARQQLARETMQEIAHANGVEVRTLPSGQQEISVSAESSDDAGE